MNRIALVLPYYGKLPWYFNYYLKSLEGIDMDVLFVSDLEVKEHPANFKPLRMSFDELNRLIVSRVEGAVPVKNVRKLCDYKPMYGHIFEEHLNGYDYWAFGDCDLVYGKRLNDFLHRIIDEGRDAVSLRKHWTSGALCILRNSERMRMLYREAKSLPEIFASEDCLCFDELGGYWFRELEIGRMSMADCGKMKEYFAALLWRTDGINFLHEDVMEEGNLAHHEIWMSDGHLFKDGLDEVCAFHYINVKRNMAFRANGHPAYDEIGDYIITKAGMFSGVARACWRFVWVWRALLGRVKGYGKLIGAKGLGGLANYLAGKW